MKKGQEYVGIVDKIKFPNKGIVNIVDEEGNPTGEKVTVKNCVEGQKINLRVTKKRSGSAEGMLLSVIDRADAEITSPCPHFDMCGGCTYQNLPYEEQLKLKDRQIHELLEPVIEKGLNYIHNHACRMNGDPICKDADFCDGNNNDMQQADSQSEGKAAYEGDAYSERFCTAEIKDIFETIVASPVQYAYRNKMEFSFGDSCRDGELECGLHKRGSFYDIVTVKDCQIVDEDYRRILKETISYFRGKETPYYHKRTHEGFLRFLLVRKAAKTGEILIDLVTSSQMPKDTMCTEVSLLDDYKEALLALKLTGKIAGILHTIDDNVADAVINERTEILYGKDYFMEEILGLKFKITPFSFFQTNTLSAEVLYSKVREYVGMTESRADVCNSVELITEESVNTADYNTVEKSEDGVAAVEGKLVNNNEKVRNKVVYDLYSGTGTIAQLMSTVGQKVIGVEIVEEAVEAAKENAALNGLDNCDFIAGDVLKVLDDIVEKPDFIILDPPRDGINPKALTKIIKYGVDNIVYVSCKPTSLARDLETFMLHGYVPVKICPIDQFPGTVHVETVVLLCRQN